MSQREIRNLRRNQIKLTNELKQKEDCIKKYKNLIDLSKRAANSQRQLIQRGISRMAAQNVQLRSQRSLIKSIESIIENLETSLSVVQLASDETVTIQSNLNDIKMLVNQIN